MQKWVRAIKSKSKELRHFKVDPVLKIIKTVYKQTESMCSPFNSKSFHLCFEISISCFQVPTFAYEKRLSRIETLRLAITYISFMDELLNTPPGGTCRRGPQILPHPFGIHSLPTMNKNQCQDKRFEMYIFVYIISNTLNSVQPINRKKGII